MKNQMNNAIHDTSLIINGQQQNGDNAPPPNPIHMRNLGDFSLEKHYDLYVVVWSEKVIDLSYSYEEASRKLLLAFYAERDEHNRVIINKLPVKIDTRISDEVDYAIETKYRLKVHLGFREKELTFSAPDTMQWRQNFDRVVREIKSFGNTQKMNWPTLIERIYRTFRRHGFSY